MYLRNNMQLRPLMGALCVFASVSADAAKFEKEDGEFLIDGIIIQYADEYYSKSGEALRDKTRKIARYTGVDGIRGLKGVTGEEIKHMGKGPNGNTHLFKLKKKIKTSDVKKITDKLMSDPDIIYAEPDAIMQHFSVPNDTDYYKQWHYSELAGGAKLPAAWDQNTGGGAVVAVLDTGITSHSDLSGQILPGYDFVRLVSYSNDGDGLDADPSDPGDWFTDSDGVYHESTWHGTHVAGTIAATTNNYSGVAGVAYNAKIVPIRVLGQGGGFLSDIGYGMNWAVGIPISGVPNNANPADVLNLSLGGPNTNGCSTSSTYWNAIKVARDHGAVVIVAAGNSNVDASGFAPAHCADAVTVASNGRSGNKAYYSNYGSIVDLSAPGGDQSSGTSDGVYSTSNAGATVPGSQSYEFKQGTSMAAPHVSGVAALLYSQNPDISNETVENILIHSSTGRAVTGCSNCGAGILDAEEAISMVCTSRNYLTKELNFMKAYLAYYGRVPDPAGMDWHASGVSGSDITPRMPIFLNSSEFTSMFGVSYNSIGSSHYNNLVNQIYLNVFGRNADSGGKSFYVGKLNAGTSTVDTIGLEILNAAGGNDKTARDYRHEVAKSYVDQQKDKGNPTSPSASDLRSVVSMVLSNETDVLDGCSAAHKLIW